ncbi:MAG: UDP-N-acetylmuramate dehydrogenase [Chitinivibrionales bacterium]|nr:UDP-N-acetylmuramate dehydrogenase [Chitinivibrionales bacterium]MBD3396717.1 UDP-N-acetylmuramate dehydrogenase [Chitinivibrionales bacterium]
MQSVTSTVPLGEKTSFKIGGPAAWYAAPGSPGEVEELVLWAKGRSLPILVLGNGSNLLVSDAGWPGLAVDMSAALKNSCWHDACVDCDPGIRLSTLVRQAVERELSGLECLAGIPGTVGGALAMNAGAFGQEISACVEYVDTVHPGTGMRARHQLPEMEFGYRHSSLQRDGVLIVGARLCMKPGDGKALKETYERTLRKRRDKQPLDLPNCGSVFKRPKGGFAGALIEQCGLKGLREGGAEVSARHANFIVNRGDACAEDVRRLIAGIQRRVHEETGVLLEPEVVFAGEFATPLYEPAGRR